jgi:4,5-dihydroxyphthalate decarboxylase
VAVAAKSALVLSAALMRNERTAPLLDGSVAPAGMTLIATASHAPEQFWRQLKFAEFDVSEMSIASFTIASSKGPTDWVALPIFTMRRMFHSTIFVRNAAKIERPADLKGKRMGVPEYQQTGAVWARGVLSDEFGVDARDMHWFMERLPDVSHGGATGFEAPAGVRLEYIPRSSSIGEMLLDGSLDATLLYIRSNLVDRSTVDIAREPSIRSLFPNPVAEGHRYFAKTGVYPINHCVVVRRALLEREPWVARSIFDAFTEAKNRVARSRVALLEPMLQTGLVGSSVEAAAKAEVIEYGIRANRPVLEMVMRYLHEQGLTARRLGLDEVFAPATLDW